MIYALAAVSAALVVLVVIFWAKLVASGKNIATLAENLELGAADLRKMANECEASAVLVTSAQEAIQKEREAGEELLERAVMYETKFNELSRSYGKEILEKEALAKEIEAWKIEASRQLSQRKSSEVRTGHLTEHLAPLLDDFPYDFKTAKFLGQPIDYICYCDEGIHFVEVKSGDSQLSSKQRKLKQLIEEGKVTFEIYRLKK